MERRIDRSGRFGPHHGIHGLTPPASAAHGASVPPALRHAQAVNAYGPVAAAQGCSRTSRCVPVAAGGIPAVRHSRLRGGLGMSVAEQNPGVLRSRGRGLEMTESEARAGGTLPGKRAAARRTFQAAVALASSPPKRGRNRAVVRLLRRAASAGYTDAQYALGTWILNGVGTKPDAAEAVRLFTRAASAGHASAAFDLAVCLELGKGCRRSLARALYWFLEAARSGEPAAFVEVARHYYFALGTRRNLALAAEWYRRAARRHDVEAQYALATLYERGRGVDASRRLALKWYQRAAAQGDTDARLAIRELTRGGASQVPGSKAQRR